MHKTTTILIFIIFLKPIWLSGAKARCYPHNSMYIYWIFYKIKWRKRLKKLSINKHKDSKVFRIFKTFQQQICHQKIKNCKQIVYQLFEMKSQIILVKLDKVYTGLTRGSYCFTYVSIKSFTVAGIKVFEYFLQMSLNFMCQFQLTLSFCYFFWIPAFKFNANHSGGETTRICEKCYENSQRFCFV